MEQTLTKCSGQPTNKLERTEVAWKLTYGVHVRQLPEGWARNQRWQRLVHELEWTLMQDVPHYQDRIQTPFAQYVLEELKHPNFLPRGYFLAF